MKKRRKKLTRVVALLLAMFVTVNTLDLSAFTAFTAYAADEAEETQSVESSEDVKGEENAEVSEKEKAVKTAENVKKTVVTVTGFDELEESIVHQQLAVGAKEEEIVFPENLAVTVSVIVSEETVETVTEEEESETSEIEETKNEESETFETEEAVNEEAKSGEETGETEDKEKETTESESAETETVTKEQDSESDEDIQNAESEKINGNNTRGTDERENENTSEAPKSETTDTENDVQNQSEECETVNNTESTDTASILDTLYSAFAPMTVYAAENKDDIVSENSTETTETIETKEITLTDIIWKLNVAESDKDIFDSSEECDGYCYVYTPVIPEKDAEGNAVILGEGVETPVIYVLIGEGEDGYDNEGFCEAWSWQNGILTKNNNEPCVHGENCNGYQPAKQNKSDGYYEIENAGQLYWFAAKVNSGATGINGRLTENITVNENVLNDDGKLNGDGSNFRIWTPIGFYSKENDVVVIKSCYTGVFDGDSNTVSGLYFNNDEKGYVVQISLDLTTAFANG